MARPRVIIVGLDSVPPRIAFDLYDKAMPCLSSLRRSGAFGAVRSTDPPVTIPAWITAMSGVEPNELGIWGFRKRVPGSYEMDLVSRSDLNFPRIWDIAASRGFPCAVVSAPLTYPPTEADEIRMASCFLTPDSRSGWFAPACGKAEIERRFGAYMVDVPDFRADDKAGLLAKCRDLTSQHFEILRHLISTCDCGVAAIVDIAPDRLHHGALGSILPEHPKHKPDGPFVEACVEYYSALDKEIERTLDFAGPDTVVIVVSDHGVQPLEGSFCVNEWLIREGLLTLQETPSAPTPLSRCKVDWSRTKAWGEGGHHGRISFNVAGREPAGIVLPDRLPEERRALARRIEEMKRESGEKMKNEAFSPDERYASARGFPPDLIVYWDDLKLRCVGSVGHGSIHLEYNDTGHDEANHSFNGIFVASGGGVKAGEITGDLRLSDLFATALDALGIELPQGTGGRSVLRRD